jgi:hypothetical protein
MEAFYDKKALYFIDLAPATLNKSIKKAPNRVKLKESVKNTSKKYSI